MLIIFHLHLPGAAAMSLPEGYEGGDDPLGEASRDRMAPGVKDGTGPSVGSSVAGPREGT